MTLANGGKLYSNEVTITLIPLILLILLNGLNSLIVLKALTDYPPSRPHIPVTTTTKSKQFQASLR